MDLCESNPNIIAAVVGGEGDNKCTCIYSMDNGITLTFKSAPLDIFTGITWKKLQDAPINSSGTIQAWKATAEWQLFVYVSL